MPVILPVYRCLLISPSDVQEERDAIHKAISAWNGHTGPSLLVYFSRQPVPQERLRDDQYPRLQELRKEYEGRALVREYSSTDNLVSQVTQHLTALVGRSVGQVASNANEGVSEETRSAKPKVSQSKSASRIGSSPTSWC